MKKFRGFTLIELLVVIAIVGVLVAIGTANFLTAQKQARDSRRQQDMEATQTAMESYYAQNQAYPTTTNIDTAFDSGTRPVGPKNEAYSWLTSAASYCICSSMEAKPGNASSVGTSSACVWASGTTATYFCVQNKQ